MSLNSLGKFAVFTGVATVAAMLGGCATPPPDSDPEAKAEFEQINDPIEPANRAIFDFNDTVDTYFLRPVAQGYRAVVPPFGRDRVADFLANLKTPIILANDLLEGNVQWAGTTLERFALNMTFGVAGVMDVATPMGIPGHPGDFGQTFGVWGIGEGPYLVLPLFGPSNPRDAVGLAAEQFGDPVDYYLTNNGMHWVSWIRMGVSGVSQREQYLDVIDDVKRTSLDYYAAMRSLYRQHREAQVEAAKHPQRKVPPAATQPYGSSSQSK